MTINHRSSWSIVALDGGVIWIVDLNEPGTKSVTNDAERVCRVLNAEWPDHRIIYRDTMLNWSELVHQHGAFKRFQPVQHKPLF